MTEQEKGNYKEREEIFSKAVRAGKRTYFFDVRATKSDEYYLTITESKRRFDHEQGKFFYEKHKVFLYKEDFEKFINGLDVVIKFIQTGERPVETEEDAFIEKSNEGDNTEGNNFSDVRFEDLDSEKKV